MSGCFFLKHGVYRQQTWNWVTGSPGHWVITVTYPVSDPEFFNFRFSTNAYMLNLEFKC